MIETSNWVPSGGLELEPNALTTATAQSGSIALTAGPGAGKTEMLAQRADFLLRTNTCNFPKRILAISFKRDASENLKDRVTKRCGRELSSRLDSYTFHAFSKRIIDIFRPFLQDNDALDENYTIGEDRIPRTQITLNDLVPFAIEILRNCDPAKNSIAKTYSDVFLDEFQDCTDAQFDLIKDAFLGRDVRLVAVGDTKQTIMGWAGALEGIFLEFETEFTATPLNLYQNFRSLPRIRRVHNSMVKDMDPVAAIDDEMLQGDEGIVSIQEFKDCDEEANWIAESIIAWRDSGIPLKEIAVLCKMQPHFYAAPLMARLAEQGIPFRNEQETQDLVCEPIFKIAVDYLIVLLGSGESDSWERLTSTLSPEEFDDTDDFRARDWNQFIQAQREVLNGSSDFDSAWICVEALLQKLGDEGVTSLSVDYEDKARFEDLVKSTKDQIKDCFDPAQECAQALKGLSEINAVRILTIHKCKGLEFHTVVVQGVEKETFWGDQEAASCAYFVAISRAKEQLVLTTSAYRERPDGHQGAWRTNRNAQSDFLGYVEPHVGGHS